MISTVLLLLFSSEDVETPKPTPAQVIERMVAADDRRQAGFPGYTGVRRYHLVNQLFKTQGEMTVEVTCAGNGEKVFRRLSESGSAVIRGRVLQKAIDAEIEASRRQHQDDSRIIPRNYDFHFVGNVTEAGRDAYLFSIQPRRQNRFLIRGRVWVDARDYAITRVEGSPAKMPSFWTRNVRIVRRYTKEGVYWLPVQNYSDADARVFGRTEMTIDYYDYRIAQVAASTP